MNITLLIFVILMAVIFVLAIGGVAMKLNETVFGLGKFIFLRKADIPTGAKRYIKDIDVRFISLVEKGANGKQVILKGDPKGQYGYSKLVEIVKIDDQRQMVYGIVYAPNQVDSQGDYTDGGEIIKMSQNFMRAGRTTNVDSDHDFITKDAFVAESWIVKAQDAFFPDDVGAWAVGIKIEDAELWKAIKENKYSGLSLAGSAKSVIVSKTKSTDVGEENDLGAQLSAIIAKNSSQEQMLADIQQLLKKQKAGASSQDLLDALQKYEESKANQSSANDGEPKPDGSAKIMEAFELVNKVAGALGIVQVAKAAGGIEPPSILIRKGYSNQDILQKADMVLGDLSSGGLVDPVRSNQFLDMVQNATVLKGRARIVTFKGTEYQLDKIGFGSRILHPAVENTVPTDAQRSKPTTGKIKLVTKEFIGEVHIPYGVLENNIEGGNLYQHILKLIADRTGIDLEDLYLNGDTASADPYLAVFDGFRKQATAHTADAESAGISKDLFKALIRACPGKYIRAKAQAGILTHTDVEFDWRDVLAARNTAAGDGYMLNADTSRAYGFDVVPVPLMASYAVEADTCADAILTPYQNMVIGISRDVTMEYDKDIRAREFIVVVTVKTDAKYEESDAVAILNNIKIG